MINLLVDSPNNNIYIDLPLDLKGQNCKIKNVLVELKEKNVPIEFLSANEAPIAPYINTSAFEGDWTLLTGDYYYFSRPNIRSRFITLNTQDAPQYSYVVLDGKRIKILDPTAFSNVFFF